MATHYSLLIIPTITILILFSSYPSHAAAQPNNTTAPPPSAAVCGGCTSLPPAPSPLSEPQPSDFPNLKQYQSYKIIQRFKKTITCDPNNITATWSGPLPCSYAGFFCETPPGLTNTPAIAAVDFNGFRLCAPTLAGFLDAFPDLALFHANSNNFSGGVPDLSALPFLYELDLSNNNHSGDFPSAVLSLPRLVFVDLRFNRFAGTVPAAVFTLASDVLFLNNNLLSLRLPADLGKSPASYLTLANNAFAGPIPRSIGGAADTLLEILFLNNLLSGCLPYEIGLLKRATVFDAGFNRITGPIPHSFGCMFGVEQLNLAGNLLYGAVPEVVCRLAEVGRLENLSLSENYFTWVGHSCWRLIRNGVLDVRRNCIFGLPEQRPAAECVWFFAHYRFCPIQLHIPCRLPYWGENLTEANAGDEFTVPAGAAPPEHKSFSGIHQPNGNWR